MPRLRIAGTAAEIEEMAPVWQSLCASSSTLFQRYDWNLLAARIFAADQSPYVVLAESDAGAAIIPACIDVAGSRISLLGEELFDYRDTLHAGDESLLAAAWTSILELAAENDLDLRFHSIRGGESSSWQGFPKLPFTCAPHTLAADSARFHHPRLSLNLRRLERQGIRLLRYTGENARLLRHIYQLKAQESGSLFARAERIEMLIAMGSAAGRSCEIFTIEQGSTLVAALVTFRDATWRRFYTTYYHEAWARYSPGLTLLHQVVRESLAAGLDCDFMTGDQPYKRRLATGSTPLYRVHAPAEYLRGMLSRTSAQVA